MLVNKSFLLGMTVSFVDNVHHVCVIDKDTQYEWMNVKEIKQRKPPITKHVTIIQI